ncbi:hypothetical protein [Deinococcus navajonensis]|uniref:Uncharacterized protein n=1 Tax=Deinococcus navajonensis TaxID=309884 RepID=A0ABV8XH19_9DEIO
MRPADLTGPELAELLHRAYLSDLGDKAEALRADERAELADYLGCHPEAREAAWEAWTKAFDEASIDAEAAEYWLDVEFTEPCHEDRAQA